MSLTKQIQQTICVAEIMKRNLCCENVSYALPHSNWESDVLSINKSDKVVEFEVKISRSDFLADKKKSRYWHYDNGTVLVGTPNRFYYACPPNLIDVSELPWFAGLLYVSDTIEVIRKAPLMNKTKHSREKLLEKFLRVTQERLYLGACALTVKNREIIERQKSYAN